MLKINDTYYELDILDILKELRFQLEEQDIHLFAQIKDIPDNYLVTCPFHKNGQERKPSCRNKKRRWSTTLFYLWRNLYITRTNR